MPWTMPHRTLQIVAFLLIATSAGSFALGLVGNLQHGGRLPGAQILGGVAGPPTVDAQEATPLSDERIEGPPPPSPEDKKAEAKNEEDASEESDEEPAVGNALAGNAAALAAQPHPLLPPIGNAAETEPPPDEPPH